MPDARVRVYAYTYMYDCLVTLPLGASPYVPSGHADVSPWPQPRSGLMSLCPYVLLFTALAANTRSFVYRVSGCQATPRRQPTWLPATTLRSTVTTESESSKLTADKIMPWLSIPLIVRGAKLATKQTCLPTKSSGW